MIRSNKIHQANDAANHYSTDHNNDNNVETKTTAAQEALKLTEEYSGELVNAYTVEPTSITKPSATAVKRRPLRTKSHNARALFAEVFLPQGFPQTVSADYLDYQRWDTMQAFASSQNGALATLAMLKGFGVGNQHATVLAAVLTWLLKDGVGMVARIVFAWARGSRLDSDNKRWRLFADLLNDASFFLDLSAPNLPQHFFAPLACVSSFLRSIVDVAGRTTRMSVIRHQARRDNLADVAAKDGSQETLVNVFSLFCSMTLLPIVDGNPVLIWSSFAFFTFIHLFANYNAVKSLQLETLNQTRFHLATRHFLVHGSAPTIQWCNRAEPLLHLLPTSLQQRHLGCQLSALPTAHDVDLAQLLGKEEGESENGGGEDGGLAWKWMGGNGTENGNGTSEKNGILENGTDANATDEGKNGKRKACLVVVDRHKRMAWMLVAAGATNAELFDALFAIEHYDLEEGWPDDATVRAFRAEMTDKGWSLQTNQLNIDEWRFTFTETTTTTKGGALQQSLEGKKME